MTFDYYIAGAKTLDAENGVGVAKNFKCHVCGNEKPIVLLFDTSSLEYSPSSICPDCLKAFIVEAERS